MDEILWQLDAVIHEFENKQVVVGLKGSDGQAIELVQVLAEGRSHLRRARSSLRQVDGLLKKGYGKLVEPEEE